MKNKKSPATRRSKAARERAEVLATQIMVALGGDRKAQGVVLNLARLLGRSPRD